ncbi:MAG: gluconate 2-dehydrogenase subunit 3 family protein [Deltaproteobacteria bacterium]|nr:gluconate 2-dehydrogenase subunit 3 family protein [Deltaproteobacteria bacterium]
MAKKRKSARPTSKPATARDPAPVERPSVESPPPAEPPPAPPSRRRFLTVVSASAVGAGAVGLWYSRREDDPDRPQRPSRREDAGAGPAPIPAELHTYDEHEFRTLDAIAGVLLPADEDPGARETGAVVFIDREMQRPAFESAARRLKVAVKAFDFLSKERLGRGFVDLAAAEQEVIVRAIFDGEADRGLFEGRAFLVLMVSLVLEGHLSEPSYGGNRDGAGWSLVGFQPMPPRGTGPDAGGHHHG